MSRITTPFNARSTAAEVIAGVDLTGKRAVVTGGASGIGLETARALAAAGAQVTLAVRNTDAGQRAAADIQATTGRDDVRVARLDLTDRSTIDAFTADWTRPLHILVNNAGVLALPERTTTPEGWETQFATNHLGHAALTLGLHDALAAAQGARVVVVSSSAQSPVVFDDIHFTSRPYDAWSAYGQSKTATILFTVALAKKWAADAITANALHPGGIVTNIQRHFDEATPALRRRGGRAGPPPGRPAGLEDPPAGCGHLRPAGRLPARPGGDRTLLRGLQRSRRRHRAGRRHERSRPLRPRPERRRPPLGRDDPAPAALTTALRRVSRIHAEPSQHALRCPRRTRRVIRAGTQRGRRRSAD